MLRIERVDEQSMDLALRARRGGCAESFKLTDRWQDNVAPPQFRDGRLRDDEPMVRLHRHRQELHDDRSFMGETKRCEPESFKKLEQMFATASAAGGVRVPRRRSAQLCRYAAQDPGMRDFRDAEFLVEVPQIDQLDRDAQPIREATAPIDKVEVRS